MSSKQWVLVDAKDMVLGRLATQVAVLLRGKHRPTYEPHLDTGDCVIVVNAALIRVTSNKHAKKVFYTHSGYPGGLKKRGFSDVFQKSPERVLEKAVKGMLPKNKLGRSIFRNLRVYPGQDHPHAAQKPSVYAPTGVAQVLV